MSDSDELRFEIVTKTLETFPQLREKVKQRILEKERHKAKDKK